MPRLQVSNMVLVRPRNSRQMDQLRSGQGPGRALINFVLIFLVSGFSNLISKTLRQVNFAQIQMTSAKEYPKISSNIQILTTCNGSSMVNNHEHIWIMHCSYFAAFPIYMHLCWKDLKQYFRHVSLLEVFLGSMGPSKTTWMKGQVSNIWTLWFQTTSIAEWMFPVIAKIHYPL